MVLVTSISLFSFAAYISGFLLFIISSAFIVYVLYLRQIRAKYRHLPTPPFDNWLVGHLQTINRKRQEGKVFNEILHEWSLEHGNLFVFWVFHLHQVVPAGPELVKKVLVNMNLPKTLPGYSVFRYVFNTRLTGKGLLAECDTQVWLRKRMVLNPAFHRKYLMNFISEFNSICDNLIEKIGAFADNNVAVNFAEEFQRVTLDIIGKVGFGMDLNAVHDKNCPFLLNNYLVMKGMQEMYKDVLWKINILKYPFQWKVIKAIKFVRDSGRDVITKRIAAIKEGKTTPNDILQHIIQLAVNNPSVTIDELVDEFVTFFLAGQETTSNLLSFTLFEIEKHADIEQRLVEEVNNVLKGKSNVSYDDLSKLEYLGWTLKESLRRHPPATGFTRYTHKEIELGGYKIPPGCEIGISIMGAHWTENSWPNPKLFDPERFATSNSIPYETYFPFSIGPRACIGKNFAQFESKIIMARLYKKFEFELVSPDKPMAYDEAITSRPLDGVWCKVKRRK